MIRLPDAQEWHIQHSTDIGVLGVIVPTVDDVDRAREAAMVALSSGGANAFDIASVPGVDAVIIGNNDLSSFSGFPQTDDRYHQLVQKVHDDVLRAGKIFGQANQIYSKGPYSADSKFFQNGPSNDGWQPPARAGRGGRGGRGAGAPEPQ